jgi:phage terminase large subunit-like protein
VTGETVNQAVRLHPAQLAFRRSRALYRAFCGGRGAGKSWVGAFDLLRRMRPGRSYLIGSPTGVLMKDTTYPTFRKLAKDFDIWGGVTLSPYPTATIILDGGAAEVRFRTAEDPERMRGPNLSAAWLDEASLMHEDAFKVAIGCLREDGQQGWLSATFTPKGPTHWTHEQFATGKPDTALFKAATDANPFLPPGFADTLRGQYGQTQYARQEVGGEFVQLEGAEWSADLIDRKDRWFKDWPADLDPRVVALDPSKGAREDSDYQAFADVRLDGNGIIWCDVEAHREGVQAMVERGIALTRTGPPVAALAVEDNDGLGMLVTEFHRLCRERGLIVNVLPIRNTVNKVFRLRRLGGYLSEIDERYGPKLRIRDTEGGRKLAAQLKDFPLGEFDDCIDALELAIRVHEQPRDAAWRVARPARRR